MAVLQIKKYPEPILRKKCKSVKAIDAKIKSILGDMAETMYAAGGVGLAAPQVGLDMRLITVDIGSGLFKLINPEIKSKKGSSILEEGCLSIPGVCVKVKRPAKIEISAIDSDGKQIIIKAEGLLAHAFSQEIDHLNGKLIIDYIPFYKRVLLRRRLNAVR